MSKEKMTFEDLVKEVEKGEAGVKTPARIKHLSIRWVLISLLGIIFAWGSTLLIAYFVTMPQMSDLTVMGDKAAEIYSELMNSHSQRFKDLAQVTFLVLVPVFSTLAGSYIRGGDE